jgi:hypothetical protein
MLKPIRSILTVVLASTVLLTGATGCASSSKKKAADAKAAEEKKKAEEKEKDPLAGAPSWVTADCRDHFQGEPVICGVGSVSGVASPSLARNTAMARGRTEIARYLQIQVTSVITDYQAAKGGTTEQSIEDQSQQVSEMTLSGSRLASYFIGKDGTYYGLMVLEMKQFVSSIGQATTIDPGLREALIQNATKTFSARDTETSPY